MAAAATWARSSTTSGCGPTASFRRKRARTVADVVGTKDAELAGLVHVHPSDTVRHTIDKMRKFDISQMPVLTAEPPVVMGEVVGSIDEKSARRRRLQRPRPADRPARRVRAPAARPDRHARIRRRACRRRSTTADALLVVSRRQARRRRHPPRPARLPERMTPEPHDRTESTDDPATTRRPARLRLLDPRDPRRAGVRPDHRIRHPAGLLHDDVRAGRHRRLPQRLRVRARRQPDARRRCRSCSPRSRAATAASASRRVSRPRTPCCARSSPPATTC